MSLCKGNVEDSVRRWNGWLALKDCMETLMYFSRICESVNPTMENMMHDLCIASLHFQSSLLLVQYEVGSGCVFNMHDAIPCNFSSAASGRRMFPVHSGYLRTFLV